MASNTTAAKPAPSALEAAEPTQGFTHDDVKDRNAIASSQEPEDDATPTGYPWSDSDDEDLFSDSDSDTLSEASEPKEPLSLIKVLNIQRKGALLDECEVTADQMAARMLGTNPKALITGDLSQPAPCTVPRCRIYQQNVNPKRALMLSALASAARNDHEMEKVKTLLLRYVYADPETGRPIREDCPDAELLHQTYVAMLAWKKGLDRVIREKTCEEIKKARLARQSL